MASPRSSRLPLAVSRSASTAEVLTRALPTRPRQEAGDRGGKQRRDGTGRALFTSLTDTRLDPLSIFGLNELTFVALPAEAFTRVALVRANAKTSSSGAELIRRSTRRSPSSTSLHSPNRTRRSRVTLVVSSCASLSIDRRQPTRRLDVKRQGSSRDSLV